MTPNSYPSLLAAEWIGVDLDGTLAFYEGYKGLFHIGPPVPAMVGRVKRWIAEGRRVKIFTARVGPLSPANQEAGISVEEVRTFIMQWSSVHIGNALEVTHEKDFGMVELWDDRAIRVLVNQGKPCCDQHSIPVVSQ